MSMRTVVPSLQLLCALRRAIGRGTQRYGWHIHQWQSTLPAPCQIESRHLISTVASRQAPTVRASTDRGPASTETTQTDFGSLNVLGNMPPPTTSIDACLTDGFHFDSGLKISGGSGCLLVSGEAFSWRPWTAPEHGQTKMFNKKGQWAVSKDAWGVLDLVWPRPGV